MATKGKRKTTMAKLAREGKLREQRAVKKAKKEARKLGPPISSEDSFDALGIDADADAAEATLEDGSPETAAQPLADVSADA